MQLKRTVVITAIVTEGLKEEYARELGASIEEIDGNQRDLEAQSRRYMLQLPSADLASTLRQQVEAETRKFEGARQEIRQRLEQVKTLEIDQRVTYATLEGYVDLVVGDDLKKKLGTAEVVIKDGVVQEVIEP